MSDATPPIHEACSIVGGQAELARRLGLAPPTVNQWCKGIREVPAERCPEIERATGGKVRCEDLRPDVAWDVLRSVPQEQVADAGQGD